MTQPPVLFQNGALRIVVQKTVDPQAITLLQQSVNGTAGVRYQLFGPETKLYHLQEPYFFYLYHQHTLIGLYSLSRRNIELVADPMATNSTVEAYYGRYLAVSQPQSGHGYGHLIKQVALRYIDQLNQQQATPYLFYSYIEAKNSRSIAISRKAGFESVARLKTYMFRRYAPLKDARFHQLPAQHMAAMKVQLRAYYGNYTFRTLSGIGYQDNYFVLEENGTIIAGLQANPVRWNFKNVPGLKGWFLMSVLPRFKAGRRLFNPTPFEFIVLEGLYLRADGAALLPILLESTLAHFGLNSAMWQLDENDPHVALLQHAKMGLLSGFEKGVTIHVMIKPVDMAVLSPTAQTPHYVSCFDYS